jgi:hypothetical protein
MDFREKEAAETNRSRINGSFNWLLISDYLLLGLFFQNLSDSHEDTKTRSFCHRVHREHRELLLSFVFLAIAVLKASFCDGHLPSSTRLMTASSFKLSESSRWIAIREEKRAQRQTLVCIGLRSWPRNGSTGSPSGAKSREGTKCRKELIAD